MAVLAVADVLLSGAVAAAPGIQVPAAEHSMDSLLGRATAYVGPSRASQMRPACMIQIRGVTCFCSR